MEKENFLRFEESKFSEFLYDNDDLVMDYDQNDDAVYFWKNDAVARNLAELYDIVTAEHPELHEDGIRELAIEYGQI